VKVVCNDQMPVRVVREGLPEGRRVRSTRLGLAIFLVNFSAYLGTFAAILFVNEWWAKVAFAIVNGLLVSTLFIIGHDACHGSLTSQFWLNRLIARISFLPSLQPFATWYLSHNGRHHGWTNLKGYDPVYPPFSKAEFDTLPWWRRFMERVYRTPLGIGLFYFVEVYLKHEMFPSPGNRPRNRLVFELDRALVLVFFFAELAVGFLVPYNQTASVAVAMGTTALSVLTPFALWNWISAFVTLQHHTNPSVAWFDKREEWTFYRGQVRGTVHVIFPRWISFLLHHIMEHTAHHVDPLVPLYNLPATQATLVKNHSPDVPVVYWTLDHFLRSLAICRLYDYQNHRWMRFDGTYSSPRTLPDLQTLHTKSDVVE